MLKLTTFTASDVAGGIAFSAFSDEVAGAGAGACKYTYIKSKENADFVPGQAILTPYNAAEGNSVKKGTKSSHRLLHVVGDERMWGEGGGG